MKKFTIISELFTSLLSCYASGEVNDLQMQLQEANVREQATVIGLIRFCIIKVCDFSDRRLTSAVFSGKPENPISR